jgi:hypothetical protein
MVVVRGCTYGCHQIYCLLTPFTAGLRLNTVFSFTLADPLLFSLTHPARAGSNLNGHVIGQASPRRNILRLHAPREAAANPVVRPSENRHGREWMGADRVGLI